MEFALRATVLRKYDAEYQRCSACGFLCTREPHWLEEAYGDAIAEADTGLVQRNLVIAAQLAALLYCCFERRGIYVDVAGGYGMLVRLMRDIGFDFFWEDKYCQNLLARGFEYSSAPVAPVALTAVEVLEHTPDPLEFIHSAMERFSSRTLIFTTELYEGDVAPPADWWYYAFDTGQHISFFQRSTLEAMASRLGLRLTSMNSLHVLTDRPLHNAWLARVLTSRAAAPSALYVRHRLGSRTVQDHITRINAERG